ncbi:MAG: hypothetical protein PWP24_919 [Clostridiales bacterium]|nr:hypothetical protein [Clostridiales bacterium]
MATIRPFQAIRPRKDLVSKIAALPYDVYNRKEAKQEVEREPLSFLAIDRAETLFEDCVDTYAPCVYEKAKERFDQMRAEGSFIKEQEAVYYLYELVMEGRSQTGIVACASIDDYLNNRIKKHENTRAEKEEDRIRHVSTLEAQTGPIFLAYPAKAAIDAVVEKNRRKEPEYAFTSPDGVTHRVWIMSEGGDILTLQTEFEGIDSIYIADGHHRAASAIKVGEQKRREHPDNTGEEPYHYFLSVLFPHDQLMILDYNRVVADLNGWGEPEFLEELKTSFAIEEVEGAYHPAKKGEIGMYLSKQWYKLTAKPVVLSEDPVEGLDVSLLQHQVLDPILGIKDPRCDKRIDFVGGIRGLEELERRCQEDMTVAFSMYPTSIEELFAVADANRLMPPKSTWFEPKLRSGIFIHEI